MTIIHATKDTFQKEVLDDKDIVFVDFYADWCGPCKATEPIIKDLAKEYEGKIKFVKVNVDQNQDLATKYNVFSIPTFITFKEGKQVNQFSGADDKAGFVKELQKSL